MCVRWWWWCNECGGLVIVGGITQNCWRWWAEGSAMVMSNLYQKVGGGVCLSLEVWLRLIYNILPNAWNIPEHSMTLSSSWSFYTTLTRLFFFIFLSPTHLTVIDLIFPLSYLILPIISWLLSHNPYLPFKTLIYSMTALHDKGVSIRRKEDGPHQPDQRWSGSPPTHLAAPVPHPQ